LKVEATHEQCPRALTSVPVSCCLAHVLIA
jgi:hypothetical protein